VMTTMHPLQCLSVSIWKTKWQQTFWYPKVFKHTSSCTVLRQIPCCITISLTINLLVDSCEAGWRYSCCHLWSISLEITDYCHPCSNLQTSQGQSGMSAAQTFSIMWNVITVYWWNSAPFRAILVDTCLIHISVWRKQFYPLKW
jgi:hypothetical protein